MDSGRGLELVTCTIEMLFTPEAQDDAVRVLVSAVGRTEAKSGCRECVVTRDATEESRVRYSEAWESKAAFQRHLQSEEFRIVLVAMDLCREKPSVVVGDLAGRSGIEYLKDLREARLEGCEEQETT
jgi:quinol monooxygenase YgiN